MTKQELIKYKIHPDNVKLLTGVEADLYVFTHEQINEVIKDELCEFAFTLFNTGELRSGESKIFATLRRIESYLNTKP